jgi:phosphoglycolate phosphatase
MSLAPAPNAAVFDFDGVIIDSRAAVRSAVNEALIAHGLPPRPEEVLDRVIGPPVLVAFAELTGEAEDSALVADCAATYNERYSRVYLDQTSLVDGIASVLGELTLPLALATAKPVEFVLPLLESLSIARYFEYVFAPAMSAPHERKTVTVANALRALRATEPIVVGDRSFDVEAAHANGVRAIGVTWGIGDRSELDAAGADVVIEHPAQLLQLLAPGHS